MITKIKYFSLVLAFVSLMGCKSGQVNHTLAPKTGMFKVTILYPNGEGKTFDMGYYKESHMPMVAGYIGQNLKFYEIDRGISGRTSEDDAPFLAIGYFYIADVAAYNQAIAKHREAIIGDFKNYTNVMPVVQISEIEQVKSQGNK